MTRKDNIEFYAFLLALAVAFASVISLTYMLGSRYISRVQSEEIQSKP